MRMRVLVEVPRRTRRRRKPGHPNGKTSTTISSPPWNAKSLEAPPDGGIFDKMLEEPCPYHKGGANHKLTDCRMLRKHFDGLGFRKDARDDPKKEKGGEKEDNKGDDGFPTVHDCYMIYGGPSMQLTARQRKR